MNPPSGPPPYDPAPFKELMSMFASALDKVDTHTSTHLNRMEIALGNMAKVASEALQVANASRQEAKETKEGLERLHGVFVNGTKCSLASSEKISRLLGTLDEQGEQQPATVMGRIRQLEQAVAELTESVSDPDAARPTIVRHEASVNTSPSLRPVVETGVDVPELDPPVQRAEAGIQVDPPSSSTPRAQAGPSVYPALVDGGPESTLDRWQAYIDPDARFSSSSRRVAADGGQPLTATATRFSSPPFAMQPLGPAHWTPQGDYSGMSCSSLRGLGGFMMFTTTRLADASSSSAANSKVPSPITASQPLQISQESSARAIVARAPQEARASSIFEEQEIQELIDDTSRIEADNTSQTASSPALTSAHLSETPPTVQAPLPRPVPPLPRRMAVPRPSTPPVASGSGASAGPSLLSVPRPNQAGTSAHATTPQQQKPSPPLPRRTVIASTMAAKSASASASKPSPAVVSTTAPPTSVPKSSAVHKPVARVTLPLPRGLNKANATLGTAGSSSSASLSSLSSVSQPSPSPPRPALSPSNSDSLSLSSLSSLSTLPNSQEQTPTLSQISPVRTRTSSRLQTTATAESTAEPAGIVSREGSARGRRRSATRGGRAGGASASARVAVKTERNEGENSAAGRAAKRRKTLGDPGGASTSASARGGRAGSRGRGGRGGAGPRKQPGSDKGPNGGAASEAGAGKGKGKARYEPPRVGTDCLWPETIEGDEAYQREFVQCDNCEGWYHFGCVGLAMGDPRLEPDAEFICPPCETSEAIREQRQNLRFQAAACARPDCERAGLAEDTNEYFVERIIGRRPYDADRIEGVKRPTRFLWLVKWDGWKADYASWTEREHLGDCARLIEEFEQAAEIEGRNLDRLDQVIVLNEAAVAGW
ncbi:hypothetical protein BV20DRAFT_620340 [Pilatotrama ljubarskyi]|nr:hypothetical protein BV20DRAFT_620340 [Pilatotrama ljubarskyi]